jgi:HAMP domain-containing protein
VRIRTKFLAVLLVELISFMALSGLSVATFTRVRQMKLVVEQGTQLIARSRQVYGLLKDVVFDLFTPESYQALRSVVLAPRSLVTGREFAHETGLFSEEYRDFMGDPRVKGILARDRDLASIYQTAAPLADLAFVKFQRLSGLFDRARELPSTDDRDLYMIIQESKDESLYGIFGEIRDSSFYLNNIFESFLSRFVHGIKLEAERLERAVTFGFAVAVIFLGAITVLLIYFLTSGILDSIRNLQRAIGRLAEGNFSVQVPIRSRDELGALGRDFQRLAGDLKKHVESIPSILKDVNEALPEDPASGTILEILSDALLREGGARCVCVLLREGEALRMAAKSGFDPLPAWEKGTVRAEAEIAKVLPSPTSTVFIADAAAEVPGLDAFRFEGSLVSLLLVPMTVRKKSAGYFLFARDDRSFTDLERSRLTAIADYAAQVLDSVEVHAALAARRDAGMEALQAQIQPHFLYNILTSLMALNRMGETKKLEAAVIALKDMLRYALERDPWSTVAEEFAFLGKYCELQKLRHGDRIEVSLRIGEGLGGARLPKLIVQPLVENAFIHGLEPKRGRGRLSVEARAEGSVPDADNGAAAGGSGGGGRLAVIVRDNGAGCTPEKLAALSGGGLLQERVGLGNVRKRLELLYPDARVSFDSPEGGGFAALLEIPLEERPQP